jgi:hypothetical protein
MMINSTLGYALMAFDSHYRGDQPDIPDLPKIYNKIDFPLDPDASNVGFEASVYQVGGEIVSARSKRH